MQKLIFCSITLWCRGTRPEHTHWLQAPTTRCTISTYSNHTLSGGVSNKIFEWQLYYLGWYSIMVNSGSYTMCSPELPVLWKAKVTHTFPPAWVRTNCPLRPSLGPLPNAELYISKPHGNFQSFKVIFQAFGPNQRQGVNSTKTKDKFTPILICF